MFTKGGYNPNFDKGLDWYFNHFNHAKKGQILGEYTPKYATDPNAPEKIKATFPKAKLIFSFRNPVERAHSQYLRYKYYWQKTNLDFESSLKEESWLIERLYYFKFLSRYLQHFDRSQMHFIIFDDLINDPVKTIQKLYTFLGVNDKFIPKSHQKKKNPTTKIRFGILRNLERKFLSFLRKNGKTQWISGMRRLKLHEIYKLINKQETKKETMKQETRNYLIELLKEDTAQLSILLDRNLDHWN